MKRRIRLTESDIQKIVEDAARSFMTPRSDISKKIAGKFKFTPDEKERTGYVEKLTNLRRKKLEKLTDKKEFKEGKYYTSDLDRIVKESVGRVLQEIQ